MMLFTEMRRNSTSPQQYGLAHVFESEHDYLIQLEAPGFAAKDIAIKATPHALSIHGELKARALDGYRTLSSSRSVKQRIEKRYRFRSRLDSERISANLNNGLLEIRVPKVQVAITTVPIETQVVEVETNSVEETDDDDVI